MYYFVLNSYFIFLNNKLLLLLLLPEFDDGHNESFLFALMLLCH